MTKGATATSRARGRWSIVGVLGINVAKVARGRGGGGGTAIGLFVVDEVKCEFVCVGVSFHGDEYIIVVVMREIIRHNAG